jgi:internalin A
MKSKSYYYLLTRMLILCGLFLLNSSSAVSRSKIDNSGMRSKTTEMIITYLDTLVSKNVLCAENLKYLQKHEVLVNPIQESQAHSSDEAFAHWKQINTILERIKNEYDLLQIKQWVQTRRQELEEHDVVRLDVNQRTKDLHMPMEFVPLPRGTSIDAFDHSTYNIEEGLEIQVTPVTQHQWSQVMEENPAKNVDGIDTEEVMIGNKKIKMQANHPVESVSYQAIEKFLHKLNENDEEHVYDLLSLAEYQAVLQACSWKEIQGVATSTGSVTTASYYEINKKRIWGIFGNIWQYTRDSVKINGNQKPHLIFGALHDEQQTASISSLCRPLYYDDSEGQEIGLRLVRRKRDKEITRKIYKHTTISWNQDAIKKDDSWLWDNTLHRAIHSAEVLRFMMENKQECSSEIQHTLDLLIMRFKEVFGIPAQVVYLKSLTGLDLSKSQIADITPLASLTNLTRLDLSTNRIHDIRPLKGLSRLNDLCLRSNQITDITALSGLKNLTNLQLSFNQIHDIASLATHNQVEHLHLGHNQISDIRPLRNMRRLISLYLFNNNIQDSAPLAGLINLNELDLADNKIRDIAPLQGLVNLVTLKMWNNAIADIRPLERLTNLTVLDVGGNHQIRDVAPLATHTQLTKLRVSFNLISDITCLAGLPNLVSLDVSNNKIGDISPVAHLKKLTTLELSDNRIGGLEQLSGLVDLEELHLEKNQIHDLTPLKGLGHLKELGIGYNRLTDLTPIAGLTSLSKLYLYGNQVRDIAPLAHLNNLTFLDLTGNQISEVAQLSGLSRLDELSIGHNHIRDIASLSNLKNLQMLCLDAKQMATFDVRSLVNPKLKINKFDPHHFERKLHFLNCKDES